MTRKNKLKNYLKIGAMLFGIMLTCLHCQKDDTLNQAETVIEKKSPFTVHQINHSEIFSNPSLSKKLETIETKMKESKESLSHKTIYLADYDFSINTDFSKYVENSETGYHSYTFQAMRDNSDYTLENLIFSSIGNDEYEIYLSQYNFSDEDIELIQNNQSPDLTDKAVLTRIIDEDLVGTVFSKETFIVETLCPDITFIAGNNCGCDGMHTLADVLAGVHCACFAGGLVTLTADQSILSWEECSIEFQTGGGGTSGGTSGGGGTNPDGTPDNDYDPTDPNNHGNNNPVISAPALEDTTPPINHTESLYNQTRNVKVKSKIAALQSVVNTALDENGMQFDKTSDDPLDFDEVEPIADETGTNHIKFPPVRLNTLINLHLHPKYGLIPGFGVPQLLSPIFSNVDIKFMVDFFIDTNENQDISSILVSDEGVFALRVTNPVRAKFMEKKLRRNKLLNNFNDDFYEFVLESPEGEPPYTNDQIIENLNSFINTYQINDSDTGQGFGLSLYQATLDGDGNITGWTLVQP